MNCPVFKYSAETKTFYNCYITFKVIKYSDSLTNMHDVTFDFDNMLFDLIYISN